MTDFLGTEFVDKDNKACGADMVVGHKMIMVVYSASWWPGCIPFKENLKTIYGQLNEGGKKEL